MKLYRIKNWLDRVDYTVPHEARSSQLIEQLLQTPPLLKDSRGKPYVLHDNLFINWSHTDSDLVVAICESSHIGVDIERLNIEYTEQLYAWVLHGEEIKRLKSGTPFAEIWTRKEAILKYTGEGIHDDLCQLNCYGQQYCIVSIVYEHLSISACSNRPFTEIEIIEL